MKKILGSLLILCLSLYAKSIYQWKIELSDNELYLHQATILSLECSFEPKGKNDDVEFIPPANVPFDFKLISEKTFFEGERKTLQYRYLLFSKEAGEFVIPLKPTMLFTTQSAIDNVIVGRDNVNDLEVERKVAELDPIKIRVKETASAFTGSLDLHARLDTRKVAAYEPVHLEIDIAGEGNLHELQPIHFEIEGVKVFSDEPEKKFVLTKQGYKGKWIQRFAFVGHENFVIPAVKLDYFELASKTAKHLQSEEYAIEIDSEGIKRDDLIDKVDLPSEKIEFGSYAGYLYYLLSFIAGFIVAKLFRMPQKTVKKQKGEKIRQAKNAKELLEVLIVCEKDLFASEIAMLEEAVYKGNALSLSIIKQEALLKL